MCKFPSFFSNHFLSPQVLTWKEVGEIDILSNCAGKRDYRICYKGTFLRHCEAQVTDKAIFGHYHIPLVTATPVVSCTATFLTQEAYP